MAEIELYLVRHGLAGERGTYANDDERPLTDEGKKKTKQVAKQLHKLGLQFDVMLTSPLVRARQTAEILMGAGLAEQLEEFAALGHGGELQTWLEWFEGWKQSDKKALALVGHEPDLTTWAETLIWGRPEEKLVLKKAGVIGLLLPKEVSAIGNSQLFWLTPPRFLIEP
jgi:phosphohistidine phosphatase